MKRKIRLATETTDSAELICRLVDPAGRAESPRPWFWVPETGMLRRWGQKIAESVVAKTANDVERVLRAELSPGL